jgi:D-tyrosyl-tRNA(Tyr) deacylase
VSVSEKVISSIDNGFLVLLGITGADTKTEADFLALKLSKLRIISDDHGKMNLSLPDAKGAMLIVSQFTLYGDVSGGNRPSFMNAARPEIAKPLYEYFVEKVKSLGIPVQTGQFGADMQISAELSGPVTILMET